MGWNNRFYFQVTPLETETADATPRPKWHPVLTGLQSQIEKHFTPLSTQSLMAKTSNAETPKLSTKKANELRFKSFLDGPISELDEFQRSLLFAEISMISYLSVEECNIAAGKLGFTNGKFFDNHGSQAYWFMNEHDSVVVCRGTEPNEWNDIQADANALTALSETVGRVHRGFKREVDDLWPYLEEALAENDRPIWFTGHSLGGAMAKICALRCIVSKLKFEPEQLFTYGSPRVGDRKYVKYIELDHLRWVNNNDCITRVPPVFLGYRHSGREMYLDRFGALRDIKGWKRFSDRLQGFLQGLRQWRIDQLSDHSILDYIDLIHKLLQKSGGKPAGAK